jgi:hypothetical protein
VTGTFRIYELRIRGVASDLVRAAFDDVEVSDGSGQTVLRTGPVDSATLYGLISRIESLGLVLMEMDAIDVDSGGPARQALGGRGGNVEGVGREPGSSTGFSD